jgi:hypothetical protein
VHRSEEIVNLRREIAGLKAETAQRLDIIEHLLNKHVRLNYTRLIVDFMIQQTTEIIKSLDCPRDPNAENECKNWLRTLQTSYIGKLREGKINESKKALSEALTEVTNYHLSAAEKNDRACIACMNKVAKALEINGSLIQELSFLSSPLPEIQEDLDVINNLDAASLQDKVLRPIAHVARLKIMLSVFHGRSRFNDFAESTKLSGGHLLYHVRKLTQYGFITRNTKSDYQLTSKGIRVLALLAQLDKE